MFDNPDSYLLLALVMFLLPVGAASLLSLWALPAWLRATRVGAGLTIFEVVGMKLRWVDVDHVVAGMALAEQFEVDISHVDLQRAAMAGANPYDFAAAWAANVRRQMGRTMEDMHALAREGKLGPLLEVASEIAAADRARSSSGDEEST